jgi:hypothetical protein
LNTLLHSAAKVGDDNEIIVIGSQSVLGQFPEAGKNPVLSYSMEADIFLKNKLKNTILVEGAIGEGSMFHQTFGYYAQEVGPNTAILPRGWEDRLFPVVVKRPGRVVTGYCLEVHDLAVAKYAAGREKDYVFLAVLINKGMLRKKELVNRVLSTKCIQPQALIERIKRDFKEYAGRHHDFGKYIPPSKQPVAARRDAEKQKFVADVKKSKNII